MSREDGERRQIRTHHPVREPQPARGRVALPSLPFAGRGTAGRGGCGLGGDPEVSGENSGESRRAISRRAVHQEPGTAERVREDGQSFGAGESITVAMEIDTGGREIRTPFVGLGFDTASGRRVFTVGSYLSPDPLPPVRGRARVVCRIPSPPLAPGAYTVTAGLGRSNEELMERVENAAAFWVIETDYFGNGRMPAPEQGPVLVRSRWNLDLPDDARDVGRS